MNPELEIQKLGSRVEQLEKSQVRQWKELEEVAESLKGIQQTLTKISYVGLGMAIFYISQEIGLTEVLKKLIL